MPNVSFVGVLIVALVAFLAPLLLGLSPARRLPSVVIEIVAGIVIGPSVLGWVRIDLPISILSLIGLAFLLFLAGMEVELERLRGRLLLYVGVAFVASMGLALLVGYALFAAGQVRAPLFIAIILVATALGVVVPLLDDAGESATDFGQLVIAGAMFAEFGSIILLSLFFSREATGTATKVVLLIGFALLAAAFAFAVLRLGRSARIAAVLLRLQDTTAQLRVRGAFVLLVAFVTLASLVGARRSVIAGLLQATSLSFIVAATQIGLVLGVITKETGAALIAAGLLSVLIFPVLAFTLLRRRDSGPHRREDGQKERSW
jgi:Kef-type K+ transport system membrane component KefB